MKLHRRDRGPRPVDRPVELPTVNMLVRLMPGVTDGREFASRVEDVRPASAGRAAGFLVAAPRYPGDLLDDPADDVRGGAWTMTWVTEHARWELPVTRSPGDAAGGPRAWWLTPAGPVRRRQRRRFYRAGCCVPVEVDQLCEPFRTLSGRTLDLSEGGLRCLLPAPDGDLRPGTRVLVRVELEGLDGLDGVVPGVLTRVRRPARSARVAGPHREVAVAFDDPERHGDAVRRVVVRLQLRARRLAPPGSR